MFQIMSNKKQIAELGLEIGSEYKGLNIVRFETVSLDSIKIVLE